MLAFDDGTIAVSEPKSVRLEVLTKPSVEEAIKYAALLSGVDVGSFIMATAYKAAQTINKAYDMTELKSEADRAAFFKALENPPKPNKQMKQAFALHKKLIANAG